MITYSTVDSLGNITQSRHTTDPRSFVPPGCRLLPDIPPDNTEVYHHDILTFYSEPFIPVPDTATEIEYVTIRRSDVEVEKDVIEKRNLLLSSSDWTQLLDSPISQEKRSAWSVYRQQLRDIPNQSGFPYQFEFPEAP